MSVTLGLSLDVLTVGAAWIAGLGLLALLFTGWRQPARAQPRTRRGVDPIHTAVPVEHRPGRPYRPAGPIRRLLAGVSSAGLSIITGAVIAVVVSFAVAFTVIRVTGLLGR